MTWIDDNKGSGPWNFTEQPDKPRYNEGDKIATAANPVWSNDHSGVPITDVHAPCGYWFKGASEADGGGGYQEPAHPELAELVSGVEVLAPGESAEFVWDDGTTKIYTMPIGACGVYSFTYNGLYNVDVRSTTGQWVLIVDQSGGTTCSGGTACSYSDVYTHVGLKCSGQSVCAPDSCYVGGVDSGCTPDPLTKCSDLNKNFSAFPSWRQCHEWQC